MTYLIKPGDIPFFAVEPSRDAEGSGVLPLILDVGAVEPFVTRDGDRKRQFLFHQSRDRLRAAGYDRHPLPWELFDLLLRSDDDPVVQRTVGDLRGETEWLDIAFEFRVSPERRSLVTYWVPQNIGPVNDHYEWVGGRPCALAVREYDISGLEVSPLRSYSLAYLPSGLVEDLVGRPVNELPPMVRDASGLYLPSPDEVWPMGAYVERERILLLAHASRRASRGVKTK